MPGFEYFTHSLFTVNVPPTWRHVFVLSIVTSLDLMYFYYRLLTCTQTKCTSSLHIQA